MSQNILHASQKTLLNSLYFSCLFTLLSLVAKPIFAQDNHRVFEYFNYTGNFLSDTVLIFNQGGPVLEHAINEEGDFFEYLPLKKLKNSLAIHMHQYQTKHPTQFTNKLITFEQAKKYNDESIRMIHETAQYFKKKDKKIYLIGLSFGAFVVQEYLATHGSELIEGSLIVVGRLSMPDAIWQSFKNGQGMLFDKKGITPQAALLENELSQERSIEEKNMRILAAGLGHKRYTKLLKNTKLPNTFYVYAQYDQQVGRLSAQEIDFLNQKGVKVIMAKASSHEDAANDLLLPTMIQMLESQK